MYINISSSVTLVVLLVVFCAGSSNMCDIQPCVTIYNNLRRLFNPNIDPSEFAGDDSGFNVAHLECSLRKNLTHCMKREEKRCRGDLNYHSLGGLIKRLKKTSFRENCSTAAIQQAHANSNSGSSESNRRPLEGSTKPLARTSTPPSTTSGNVFGQRRKNGGGTSGGGSNASGDENGSTKISDILVSKGRNRLTTSSEEDEDDEDDDWDDDDWDAKGVETVHKCTPKPTQATQKTVGCALYGLTNLKSFHDPLNFTDFRHCSLTGSWSLIDTPEFAVQITNREGYPPMPKDVTMTTLVTVILKHNDCSQRKTYQATYDEVPGMFTDGSNSAGTVLIETIIPSEHVRINMQYFHSSIDIVKVVGQLPIPSLSITIKMPSANVTNLVRNPSQLNGLPLCFYGCPKVANLLSIKPRAVSTYKCTPPKKKPRSSLPISSEEAEESVAADEPPREEFLDTSTSINAAICDSLLTVQNILGDKSTILKEKLSFPGEETNNYATLNDQGSGQQLGSTSSGSRLFSSLASRDSISRSKYFAENSALNSISQNIGCKFSNYYHNLFFYSIVSLILVVSS